MNRQWRADIIVGIDFGMTCSGVAWSMGPEWPEPKNLQHWPGKSVYELRNKVDTSISYSIQTGARSTWGFLCNPDNDQFEYNSLFKLNLDPSYKDPIEGAPTCAEARTWYRDYLKFLYEYIMEQFTSTMPHFSSKRIDFVFSVPVTWRKNPAMLAQIEQSIREAGFGQNERERASVYLTEAEAAAIYASQRKMLKGEVFLVCDAGGGTTDINVLRVESTAQSSFELMPLSWTEGEAVGSTLIDWKIRMLLKARLAAVKHHMKDDTDLDVTVSRMMADKFDSFKCSFGRPTLDVPKLFLPIPGIPTGLDIPESGIEDSRVVVTKAELQAVFDDQVDKICRLIDNQLRLVADRHAQEQVSYLVLSGGLGSSPYLQTRIRSRYGANGSSTIPNAKGLQVLVAGEPQLAVVHGLVSARMQANKGGPDVYTHRCCPVSFGIVCRQLYNPAKHQGEVVTLDPYDKQRWAERQISWIITQGQVVRSDLGISQHYRLKLELGMEREPWTTRIVMSTLSPNQLPKSLRWNGAKDVCTVESVLNPHDMKKKNRHWYNLFKKQYYRAEFEVRIIVGTGLRFQIWSKDGIRSRDHEEIEVQWENVDGSLPAVSGHALGFQIYRK